MSPAFSSLSTTLDMALWVMGVRSPSCFIRHAASALSATRSRISNSVRPMLNLDSSARSIAPAVRKYVVWMLRHCSTSWRSCGVAMQKF